MQPVKVAIIMQPVIFAGNLLRSQAGVSIFHNLIIFFFRKIGKLLIQS